MSAPMPTEIASATYAFGRNLSYASLPAEVRCQAARCLVDLLGVAAAGSGTVMARISRSVALSQFGALPGQGARTFFSGGTVSAAGAAMANAAALDSYDAHDGHALTKGHVGATVLPAILAAVDCMGVPVSGEEFIATLVMGYEIGLRSGIALHATASDYHSSGAWAAIGAAAVMARRLGLSELQWREALGIAEYHGPRGPMMRCIDFPSMVKDGATWGAMTGVTAALMAQQGFTGAPAELLEIEPIDGLWSDLGTRWRMLDQYFKPYPVCRWAQPAIQAALALRAEPGYDAALIDHVEVLTFTEACRLGASPPKNTEQAQYNLGYPLACALVLGRVGALEISEQAWRDPVLLEVMAKTQLREDAEYSRRFPAERCATVKVRLRSGRTMSYTSQTTLGDPSHPLDDVAIKAKALDSIATRCNGPQASRIFEQAWCVSAQPDVRPFLNLFMDVPVAA